MLVWNEISWRDETCFVFNCWRFHLKTFDYARLLKCSIGFWVSTITEPNRSQSKDRRSIEFDYRTFDWPRRAYEISAQFCERLAFTNAYVNFTFCWSSRNTGNLYICHLTKGFKSNSPIIKQSTHSTALVDKVSLTWSSSVNPQTFVHPFGNTNVSYSDVLFGPFSSLFFSVSSNYMLKLKYFLS